MCEKISRSNTAVLRWHPDGDDFYFQIEGGPASAEPGVPFGHITLDEVGATALRDSLTNWLETNRSSTPATLLSAWRERLAFNKTEAAQRLGLSRNTYAAYEEGNSKIPAYIALACAAIERGVQPI